MAESFGTDELDEMWRQLADEGNDAIISAKARWERAQEEAELCLAELRDYARMKLTEKGERK